jgi:hypothetical protein
MRLGKLIPAGAIAAGFIWMAISLVAQDATKARLSPVPADQKTRADLAGSGSVTATLAGTRLTINGTFEGLKSPATMAELHSGVAAGVRGPLVAALTVTKATSGSISGTADLTPAQVANYRKGGFYLELYSEKTPEGVLWGWLLK